VNGADKIDACERHIAYYITQYRLLSVLDQPVSRNGPGRRVFPPRSTTGSMPPCVAPFPSLFLPEWLDDADHGVHRKILSSNWPEEESTGFFFQLI